MAVAGRSSGTEDAASTIRETGFARLLAAPDADALAAAGLLADALAHLRVPFHASVHAAGATLETTDDTTTISVGTDDPADLALAATDDPASATAFGICRALGTDPDPLLALAGAFAADGTAAFEGSNALGVADDRGLLERRPGVAIPVTDPADGLAHSTLAHADFSGDADATAAALSGLDTEDGRRVASLLALAACADATPRGADAVARALKPYAITEVAEGRVGGRFATVGGFADVLDAAARESRGTGLALALGHDVREAALDAWRTHADRAHRVLREASTERHRNLFVARTDADASLRTAARLLSDFRSPESISVVVGETRAAAAAHDDAALGDRLAAAGAAAEGDGGGGPRRAWARFEDRDAFVTALREAVA